MKSRLLYVGHAFHKKTKSVLFLYDLFAREYDRTDFFLDPQMVDSYAELDLLSCRDFDVLVCLQVMPDLKELRRRVTWKRGIFIPMYDYVQGCMTLDRSIWYEYRDFRVINFARTLHDRLLEYGFDSKYIQYFPEPVKKVDWGADNSVFFWQRITRINLPLLARVLAKFGVARLHLHKVLDPGESFTDIPTDNSIESRFFEKLKITTSEWYDAREDMLSDMLKAALYMAPRPYEGIGMGFLEAMANGRCVVAPDCPTMNEYIMHGENGLLYAWNDSSLMKQQPISLAVPEGGVRRIQRNAYEYVRNGYEKWSAEKYKILEWMGEDSSPDYDKINAVAKEIGWVDAPIEEQPRPSASELEPDVFVKEPVSGSHDVGTPDVTVITVVFNAFESGRGAQFRQCLDSVQTQTGVRLEHLVVDGGSKDETVDFLRDYQNDRVRMRVFSKPDRGIYDAMNRGLILAKGKYVIFLNSDDYYHDPLGMRDSFLTLERTLCDFSYAPIRVLREEDDEPMDHPNVNPMVGKIFVNMEFSHQSVMIRRDAFLSIHGFDMRYRSAADYDSVLRLIFSGCRACCVPRSFVTFRMGGFSCVNMEKSQRETGMIFSRLYNRYAAADLSPEDGLYIYLTSCFPLELKERLFRYYVSAFGGNMVEAESDDFGVPEQLRDLIAFKHGLLPLKKGLSMGAIVRNVVPAFIRHPLWTVELATRYRKAYACVGKKDAARLAFNEMGKRLLEKRRRGANLRMIERCAAVRNADPVSKGELSIDRALPVRTKVSPSDFWNVYGAYESEPWGVWSGRELLIKIRIPKDFLRCPLVVDAIVGGYVFPESPKRVLTVKINGKLKREIEVNHIDPRSNAIIVPAEFMSADVLELRISSDAEFIPNDLGHSTDTRKLGITFGGLSVSKMGKVK